MDGWGQQAICPGGTHVISQATEDTRPATRSTAMIATTKTRLRMNTIVPLVNCDFATRSGFVLTQQEGKRNHHERRDTKDEEHVLVGKRVRLLL